MARQPQARLDHRAASSQRWVDRGVRGITSNPSIFQKAIERRRRLRRRSSRDARRRRRRRSRTPTGTSSPPTSATRSPSCGRSTTPATASTASCRSRSPRPRPRHRRHRSPRPATSTTASTEPNLYVKIPGTAEGVPAIQQMIAEGRSINVTLLFSLERYAEVIEAYLSGLEAAEGDLSPRVVGGVVLRQPGRHRGRPPPRRDRHRRGARPARARPRWPTPSSPTSCSSSAFPGPRWEALAARGARVQRPLWASTSTKNPAYPDTLYVDTLIGPDTVNTMPDATLDGFDDHGTAGPHRRRRPRRRPRPCSTQLAEVGVDLDDVTRVLEDEGVAVVREVLRRAARRARDQGRRARRLSGT